jgi:hypothetical protein
MKWLWLLILPLFVFSQGMITPERKPRPSSLARVDKPLPEIRFEDAALAAGLRTAHVSGHPVNKKFLVEATGSGIALVDYDNDSLLDIFLVNGTRWKPPYGPGNRLYRNLGGLRFEDVTARAGIAAPGWGQGVCAGDYDNDGFTDLYVTYWGHNLLFRSRDDSSFRDVTAGSGLATSETRWGTGCAFFDYDRDGLLDLAVAGYASLDPATTPLPGANPLCMHKGLAVVCGPRGLPGGVNRLYRNIGGGRFTDVSAASGFRKPAGYFCFSVVPGDFDNDGWQDVYIACDSTPSILFHNRRDGTFEDIGVSSGTAFNENGEEQAGMGAAAGDFLNTGSLHLVKTNFAGDTPTLYQNDGKGFFADVTVRAGLAVQTRFLGWGVGFFDADNDGWQDIFMANGHVYPQADRLRDSSPYRQRRNLYWNLGNGAFADLSERTGPGVTSMHSSRGAAFGDLDNDGTVEIVVNNLGEPPSLLVNKGPKGNWLLLRLRGAAANRDALGARVTVHAGSLRQSAEVTSGGSYLSQNDLRLHFGLGQAAVADRVDVRWPGGETESFPGPLRGLVLLEQGKAGAR